MNLKNFEQKVEGKILDRGFSYYENDQIQEVEQIERKEFCAIAYGSQEYNVYVKLGKNLEILEHECDCPYDWGEICKHEVGLLYYLRDSKLYEEPVGSTKMHQMKNGLENMNKKELIELITEICKKNRSIREDVLWELGYDE